MTTGTLAVDALTALPPIDPAAAALGQAVCILIGQGDIATRVVHDSDIDQWFGARDDVRFAILRAGGRSVTVDPDRLGSTVALLDRIDPLLTEIERALDLSLEPQSLDGGRPTDVVIVRADDGENSVLLAVPLAHPSRGDWGKRVGAVASPPEALPMVLRCLLTGPRIAVAEASALSTGDMVLIGARAPAWLETADGTALHGQIDIAAGIFALHPQGGQMADADPTHARDFVVPLTIRLPDRMTSAATLAALRPGVTLPLGPLTDGMAIELLVAGRPLAKGELVQLGDRFGVLIEERVVIEDVPPAEEPDPDAETLAEDAE